MTWSLGETESLARRAARGAGMDWGMAEEAGRAVRWLCAAGWPGARALAALLSDTDGAPWEARRPQVAAMPWQARGGLLCPVAAGAALSDRAGDLAAGTGIRLGPTAWPLLLVPFMARAAEMTGAPLSAGWTGVTVGHDGGVTRVLAADPAALAARRADAIVIGLATARAGNPVRHAGRAEVDTQTARRLTEFAGRLLAPETPGRRRAGAGAGPGDND